MNKKKGIGIAAFALLVVVIAVSYFSLPSVHTIKAVKSEYVNKIEFKGVYFTKEYVIDHSPVAGKPPLVKEGQRVSKAYELFDGVYSSAAGIFSSRLDGYENRFDKSNVFHLKLKDLAEMKTTLKEGVKIIDNSVWYVYAATDKSKKLRLFNYYDLSFNNGVYPGDIIRIEEDRDAYYYLFRIKYDLNIINLHRNLNGYIIKSKYNGIVVPAEALTTLDGRTGVLVSVNGYAEFRRVEIIYEDQDNHVIVIMPDELGRKLFEYDDIIVSSQGLLDGAKIR